MAGYRRTESSIEQAFVRWCKKHGYATVKLRLNPGRGWPDRAVLLPNNIVCWIEFKTPTGEVRPQQEFIFKKMAKCGHEVFIARSVEDAANAIARLSESGR